MKPPKKLLAEWNRRLRADGFVDIEAPLSTLPHSRYSTWYFEAQWDTETFRDIERYYQLAGSHTYSHKFESFKDKAIWRLHAEGYSSVEISEKTDIPDRTVRYMLASLRRTIKVD